MFAVIKRFLGGLFGRRKVEPPPAPPHDPYAYRTAPRKRGPYDRGGAVAVLEPDEDEESGGYPFEKVNKYS
jgi:hypothetical protein